MVCQLRKAQVAVKGHWLEVAMLASSWTRTEASLVRCCGQPTCEDETTPTTSTLLLRCPVLGDSAGACAGQWLPSAPDGLLQHPSMQHTVPGSWLGAAKQLLLAAGPRVRPSFPCPSTAGHGLGTGAAP